MLAGHARVEVEILQRGEDEKGDEQEHTPDIVAKCFVVAVFEHHSYDLHHHGRGGKNYGDDSSLGSLTGQIPDDGTDAEQQETCIVHFVGKVALLSDHGPKRDAPKGEKRGDHQVVAAVDGV